MAGKNFKSLDSLKNVENVINEASEAISQRQRKSFSKIFRNIVLAG